MNSYEQHLTYVLTYKQDMFRYENEHSRSNLVENGLFYRLDKKIKILNRVGLCFTSKLLKWYEKCPSYQKNDPK